jgi:DnaJ-domain-containing protein 1
MKVNVTIDCTPEEARNFMGLPDLKPMQDRMMSEIEQRLRAGVESMNPDSLVKTWLPASMQGIEQVQQIQNAFWQQLASIASGKKE